MKFTEAELIELERSVRAGFQCGGHFMGRNGLKLPGNNGPRMWRDREIQRLCDAPLAGTSGEWWHDPKSITRRFSSKSPGRKAASAEIAKIPFELARHIAAVYKPQREVEHGVSPSG